MAGAREKASAAPMVRFPDYPLIGPIARRYIFFDKGIATSK
jgi:hypothetical protein